MADVRCPMCGKSNPPEAEKCLFCGEALITGSPEHPADQPADESGDWLSGLRSGSWQDSSTPGAGDDEQVADGEPPDWLSRVRSRTQADQPLAADIPGLPQEPASQADDLDWLKNLGGEPASETGSADDWFANAAKSESEPAQPLESSAEDWLSGLRTDFPSPNEQAASPAPESISEIPGQPTGLESPKAAEDWMSSLTSWNSPTEAEQPAAEPDFSAALPEQQDAPLSTPQAQGSDLPDWFSQLTVPGEPVAPQEEAPAIPNWLTDSVEPAPAASAAPDGEQIPPAEEPALPDWLAGFSDKAPEEQSLPDLPAPAPIPEWLAGAEPVETAAGLPASPVENLPDWLQAAPLPTQETGAEPAAADNLDWLSGIETPAVESISSEPAAEPAADLSAIFQNESEAAPADETLHEPTETVETASVPDFSALFASEAEASPAAEEPAMGALLAAGAVASAAAEEAPAEVSALPDWMTGFGEAGRNEPVVEAPLEGAAPFVNEELPAWLNNVQPQAVEVEGVSALIEPPEPAAELNEPFQVELPDWLDKEAPGEAALAASESQAEEPTEELVKADLPSWVEDMRPLESVIPGEMRADTGETIIEKAGPLAGMRGVLQGEDLSARYRKPPVYSARLRVSERQRSQAAILENLLGLETTPKEVSSEPSRAPQLILRMVIALLLILPLLTMLLPDFRLIEVPAAVPPGMAALYESVERLPTDAAVLLAFDYEPGLSGEMRYAANSVIEHLMVKNARLAIVSTVPTGPVLAEDLLAEVHNRRPDYSLADRTVNLGYLPGGTTSLLEFAQNPRSAAPSAIDTPLTGTLAWDYPAVAGLGGLNDFALVIVITDSPETGRTWVEQVQPMLGSVPLAMVTSAQAGPMLQPYYASGQIQGMAVGLQGGALYEQKSGRVNLANRFWGSYQTGMLAGVLLLIIGGIISGVLGLSNRKPAQKGKA
jgi:hypothetical protein